MFPYLENLISSPLSTLPLSPSALPLPLSALSLPSSPLSLPPAALSFFHYAFTVIAIPSSGRTRGIPIQFPQGFIGLTPGYT